MFYTFVDRIENRIFHRFVDSDGNRKQEVVRDFDFDLYVKTSMAPDSGSIYGEPLKLVQKKSVQEMRAFVSEMSGVQSIYGMTDPVSQFIAKTYPDMIECDFSKMRCLALDIETRFDGYEDNDVAKVRRIFSNHEQEETVGWVRQKAIKEPDSYEVWDKYNNHWYPVSNCPQLQPGGFPNPHKAEYEITAVSLKRLGKSTTLVLGLKDFKETNGIRFIRCENEAHLLREFIAAVQTVDPDIITGWNIEGFDIPYLINRIEKVLGPGKSNALSPFRRDSDKCVGSTVSSFKGSEIYKILGIAIYDYMVLYKAFNPSPKERYGLDFIAQEEGVGEKVDYSEYKNLMELYEKDYHKFIIYNAADSEIVEKLDQKKQFLLLAVTTVQMTKSRFQDVFGKVKMWDNLIYNLALNRGVVIPPMTSPDGDAVVGAYVKEPIPGMYRWVVSLDLTALYPTIVMMFNMSPETLLAKGVKGDDALKLVERFLSGDRSSLVPVSPNACVTANGAQFDKTREGLLVEAMRFVFDTRKSLKKKMLAYKVEQENAKKQGLSPERIAELDNLIAASNAGQGAMKVLGNSGYGALANDGFRYNVHPIAEGITMTGQLCIRYIGDFTNKYLNKRFGKNKDWIITSDTDSMYLSLDDVPTDPTDELRSIEEVDAFVRDELQPAIEQAYIELSEILGADKNMFDMKREAISSIGFWRGKKNYALRMLDNEGVRFAKPEIKIMGLEPVRSDRPMVVRQELRECIDVILNSNVETLRAKVKEFEARFKSLPVSEIATPKGISDMNATTAGHVRSAHHHNRLIDEYGLEKEVRKLKSGDKVRVAALKTPNPVGYHTIAFMDELPSGFNLEPFLDYDRMFDTFLVPITSYCDAIGWKLKKVASFEDLF